MDPESITLKGKAKEDFLSRLDSGLYVLSSGLVNLVDEHGARRLKEFGDEKEWDWSRIPDQSYIYRSLSTLVERVRKEYDWFRWTDDSTNPENNKGYFEEIDISTESGLPWVFDFIALERLKGDADKELAKLPAYGRSAKTLAGYLLSDDLAPGKVEEAAQQLHKQAMNRNYLEALKDVDILNYKLNEYSIPPTTRKIMPYGIEDLWNVTFLRYIPASSMFEIYLIDAWQDNDKDTAPVIHETGIDSKLANLLQFGEENTAWYILESIDHAFDNVHPVHVTRGLIGPYESRYMLPSKTLPQTGRILKKNQDFTLLRFKRQYSYAPNHEIVEGRKRQLIERQNWHDEILVCPAQYSSQLSRSIEGSAVRIFEV